MEEPILIELNLSWWKRIRTNKWLAEQLGKDPATVSKWCTNTSQPQQETLIAIADILGVHVEELLNRSQK